MAKTKLAVVTEHGTFTRTTARTYTHLVIVKGYRAELVEAYRLGEIKAAHGYAKKYRAQAATGVSGSTAYTVADLLKWADDYEASAARLEALGPITDDKDSWGLHDANLASVPAWGVLGWSGRLDLARNLARGKQAAGFRDVVIIDVATGKAVA